MRLRDLKVGEDAIIVKILGHGAFRKRLIEMGFVRGKLIKALLSAPMRDPVKYSLMGYEVSLRRSEADLVEVIPVDAADLNDITSADNRRQRRIYCSCRTCRLRPRAAHDQRGPYRKSKLRQDIVVQHRVRQSRACGQLFRRDRGSKKRCVQLSRLPVQHR